MALSADRNTPRRDGRLRYMPVAASTKIYAGALVMKNASVYATKGATATVQVAVGRANESVDNSSGTAGAAFVTVEAGEFKFKNSASTDLITIADVGVDCYIVDDETVAKTHATNTRSIAGKVTGVDADGVWVRVGF
jgi:hypothetical protein